MIEISGRENKVRAFIDRVAPFGITELVRTGRIAMVRSAEMKDENDGIDLDDSDI
jgi:acetolactate synthase-1/3 small subunit